MVSISYYLILSGILFSLGVLGVLFRRNILIIFMAIELMLNAVNLAFIAIARYSNSVDGQLLVFFVIAVAAAEVSVGLAIIITIFRNKETVDVDAMNLMKG